MKDPTVLLSYIDPPIARQTFYVLDPNSKDSHKASRSCNACYDTVFPLIQPTPPSYPSTTTTISPLTLSGLKSMPSLLLGEGNNKITKNSPSVLMALENSPKRSSSSHRLSTSPTRPIFSAPPRQQTEREREREDSDDGPNVVVPAIRIKPPTRPRSYVQILEDFNENILSPLTADTADGSGAAGDGGGDGGSPCANGIASRYSNSWLDSSSFVLDERDEDETEGQEEDIRTPSGVGGGSGGGDMINQRQGTYGQGPPLSFSVTMEHNSGGVRGLAGGEVGFCGREDGEIGSNLPSSPRKKEDTVRRHKRFSLPAVAIQTTPVTTRPNVIGKGKTKRFSLLLGRAAGAVGHSSRSDLGHGVAAGKLNELLKRNSRQVS